jgi:TIP49-like protein
VYTLCVYRALESDLAPIMIMASNRGITRIRGTGVCASVEFVAGELGPHALHCTSPHRTTSRSQSRSFTLLPSPALPPPQQTSLTSLRSPRHIYTYHSLQRWQARTAFPWTCSTVCSSSLLTLTRRTSCRLSSRLGTFFSTSRICTFGTISNCGLASYCCCCFCSPTASTPRAHTYSRRSPPLHTPVHCSHLVPHTPSLALLTLLTCVYYIPPPLPCS